MSEDALWISLDHAIDVLNRALEADPHAITYLMESRVAVNDALADDPTVQVQDHTQIVKTGPLGLERRIPIIGTMGLINGLFGIRDDGYGYITMVIDDETGMILRFEKTQPED